MVFVIFVPAFAVIGNGSGIYTTSFFAIVTVVVLPAPKFALIILDAAADAFLKALFASFHDDPVVSV